MKKIAKLSLVAAVAVAGLSTSAMADTLAEAFANSKVKGEIKSQYFQKEFENGSNTKSSIWSNGGNLSLTTGSFYGLTAGVTFQTGHVASIDDDRAGYAGDMDASGSVMSEAYLAYTLGNTTAKIGRQYISTPLVAGSGSRMFKQSFEGAVLINTDVPNTVLVAAAVDKFQGRTDAGDAPSFNDNLDLGTAVTGDAKAYTVYAKNTSIANLAVQAQYAQIDVDTKGLEDVKALYIDGSYKLNPITISAQMYDTTYVDGKDGTQYGIKVAGNVAGISAMAAYSTTDDSGDVVSGLGAGADGSYTASPIAGGGASMKADTDSYKVGLGYKFAMGLGLNASYTNWDNSVTKLETSETNVTASYAFNKNLSTKVMYSTFDNDTNTSTKTLDYRSRVYVSYKF